MVWFWVVRTIVSFRLFYLPLSVFNVAWIDFSILFSVSVSVNVYDLCIHHCEGLHSSLVYDFSKQAKIEPNSHETKKPTQKFNYYFINCFTGVFIKKTISWTDMPKSGAWCWNRFWCLAHAQRQWQAPPKLKLHKYSICVLSYQKKRTVTRQGNIQQKTTKMHLQYFYYLDN